MGEGMMITGWFILIWIILISILEPFIDNTFINIILLIIISTTSWIIFWFYMAYKWNDYNWMCDIGSRSPVKKDKPTLTTHVIKCEKKEME